MEGVFSLEHHFKTGLLYRGCSLKTGFIEGVLSSECPLKTGFTV